MLELGSGVAVRYCGRLFSLLGARVLRVGRGEDERIGYARELGEAYGRWLDQGKHFIEDVDVQRLDVVIGGQYAHDIKAAEEVAASHGAVLLAMTWFDLAGPYRDWQGSDEIIAALAGIAYSFGERTGPPMLAQGHAPQITAGLIGLIASLASLLVDRDRRPKRIDVNVHEASMCYSETATLSSHVSGEPSVRLGVNRFVPTYPCSPYRTSDGWVGVTCLTPQQWLSLCALIERADLAADPELDTAYKRLMRAEQVDAALAPVFVHKTREEWVALGMAHRIPIAPMIQPGQLPKVPHWIERGAFTPFGADGIHGPALPYRIRFNSAGVKPWHSKSADAPLADLRVVDFGMGWAGPLCGRTLGDLGADVVKIESEAHPDWWRGWDAGAVDMETRERQHNFINVNRNKRGVDFDLTQSGGRSWVKALIAGADVVVENYAAGVLTKLGLGPDTHRDVNPSLITVSMPAFGNGGPLSGIRAYGSTVEQSSGLPFANGESHWVPVQQHIAFGDPIAGLYGASAVLAALHARHRLGGAYVDLSQVACLFQLGADAIITEQVLGAPVHRSGHARARLAFCAVVPAAGEDQWLCVAAPDAVTLERLHQVVQGDDRASVSKWAAMRDARTAAAELQSAGILAAPVNPPHVLMDDAQLSFSGYFAPMQREYVGEHFVAASPWRFNGERPVLRRPAPLLGEHTAEVMAEIDATSKQAPT